MKRYGKDVVVRARELRAERQSVGSIAKQIGVSTVTVFNWVRDMGVVVPHSGGHNGGTGEGRVSEANRKKMADGWRKVAADKRQVFYDMGREETDELLENREIRDFVCLYWAEGYKRSRNVVSVVNTDPAIVRVCAKVMTRFAQRPLRYRLICSENERITAFAFWAKELGVDVGIMKFQNKVRKSSRRAEAGLMEVGVCDTFFRSRLQAWMDRVRRDW